MSMHSECLCKDKAEYLHRSSDALEEVRHDEGQDAVFVQNGLGILETSNVIPPHTQISF